MYVYILTSLKTPNKHYVGKTTNPKTRLEAHNTGKCHTTNPHRPWKYQTLIWLNTQEKANKLERYLKTGSGRAFSKKHF